MQQRTPRGTTTLLCAGRVHVERGLPVVLDIRARTGSARVGLIEDGAMFCSSCAHEVNRGTPAR